jgi:hypothetical protein
MDFMNHSWIELFKTNEVRQQALSEKKQTEFSKAKICWLTKGAHSSPPFRTETGISRGFASATALSADDLRLR